MERKITFLTGNPHKKEIAENIFKIYGLSAEIIDIHLDEIQEECIERIATWSALQGAKQLNRPVIKTDVGFSIDALNGFPGAYGKYVFPQIGVNGLLRLMNGKKNRHATSIEVLAFATPDGYVKTWKKIQDLEILTVPKGAGSAIEQLMVVTGEHTVNYGSLSQDEKLNWWVNNNNYFHDFAKWYINHNDSSL